MGYLGEEIPKLGFGLMRLPMIGDEVDIEQTKQMVDIFMKNGFTYFDTAYGYINGKSEEAVKTCIVDRYPRDSFTIATKLPAWAGAKDAEEAKQMFYTSLKRTGAGYFDFYLLHNLGDNRTEVFDKFGIWDFVNDLKAQGLIKHLGFSFHDTADKLEEVLKAHPEVEFVQLQINYIDWEDEHVQSRKNFEVCKKYGKPVVVMEPVKGGTLARLPEDIAKIFKDYNPNASIPSWALRYVASKENLITVLSGMSNIEQMEDNVSFMKDMKKISDDEQKVIDKVIDALHAKPTIPCTGCSYCTKGCPMNINIPGIFNNMNTYLVYENADAAKGGYRWSTNGRGKVSDCIKCGQCESVCPQHIKITEELEKAAAVLEE